VGGIQYGGQVGFPLPLQSIPQQLQVPAQFGALPGYFVPRAPNAAQAQV
jgi:hypothetical protein